MFEACCHPRLPHAANCRYRQGPAMREISRGGAGSGGGLRLLVGWRLGVRRSRLARWTIESYERMGSLRRQAVGPRFAAYAVRRIVSSAGDQLGRRMGWALGFMRLRIVRRGS